MEGETIITEPVSIAIPLHESENQCHVAPGDNAPLTWRAELLAEQIGEIPLAETGSAGVEATLILVLTQTEEQIPFSARTK